MDTSVLTDEIKKANNPGFTDFGGGSVIALASQCLCCKKLPTPCAICFDFCPVDAIVSESNGQPRITAACLKCAACVGICPVNAIGNSTHNIQYFKREALKATLRVKHLAVTCERTLGLLRLESKTDAPESALRALRLIEESRGTSNLIVMPCLAMITREMWFSVLSEIGTLRFEALSIYLPTGQCGICPVNAKDNIEELFAEAISEAEQWSEQSVGIITEAKDLPQLRKSNVRSYLIGESELDRRGAFTGFLDELKKTWEENTDIGNQAINEVQVQRERKESFERTLLSADLRLNKPANKSSATTTSRFSLVEALGRHVDQAKQVRLMVSTTDGDRCVHCGICADACPLKARFLYDTSVDKVEIKPSKLLKALEKTIDSTLEDGLSDAGLQDAGLQDAGLQVGAQKQNTDKTEKQVLIINQMYCVACSACIQACPNEACYFTEIEGSDFLVEKSDDVTLKESG